MQLLKKFNLFVVKQPALWLLGTAILSVFLAILINQWMTPKVVTFDLKGTVRLFSTQLSQNQMLSQDAKDQYSKKFTDTLESAVMQYGNAHHVIVVVSPAILAGASDATPAIQDLIAEQLANGVAKP